MSKDETYAIKVTYSALFWILCHVIAFSKMCYVWYAAPASFQNFCCHCWLGFTQSWGFETWSPPAVQRGGDHSSESHCAVLCTLCRLWLVWSGSNRASETWTTLTSSQSIPYKHAHISYFNCFAHAIMISSHFLSAPALTSISCCVVNCYIVATSQTSFPPQSPGLLAEPEQSLHQWVTPHTYPLSRSLFSLL